MMSLKIRDMLFVKTLEKTIGRKLKDYELNCMDEFEVRIGNKSMWVKIPLLKFPDDLLSIHAVGIRRGSIDAEVTDRFLSVHEDYHWLFSYVS